jgi:hypothetical protein
MLPARAALGAVAAVLFGLTDQVTGPYGALAFGCAAPVLLSRLGLIPQIAKAIDTPSRSRNPEVGALADTAMPELHAGKRVVP